MDKRLCNNRVPVLNEVELPEKTAYIQFFLKKIYKEKGEDKFLNSTYFHYTPFPKLFDILEGDSFWASRSRFSNDSTEEHMINEKKLENIGYKGDNYIVCFCDEGDMLSQWRGYCFKGGVSIELDNMVEHIYTLMHSESEVQESNTVGMEKYLNKPLKVIYSYLKNPATKEYRTNEPHVGICDDMLIAHFDSNEEGNWNDIFLNSMIPYLKNDYFYQEKEARLVFDNSDGSLDKCIRFRKLSDGTMLPYIVVKYGDIANNSRRLSHMYTEKYINEIVEELNIGDTITIPCGRDQSSVCRKILAKISKYEQEKKWRKNSEESIKVICDGHLPIISITVSPAPNQEYMREVIERYCKSKYWLQNVHVKCSRIPYIAPDI